MTEPNDGQQAAEWQPSDPDVRVKREQMRVEFQHQRAMMTLDRERAQMNALGPELLERMAWATELARSELVPPGFRNPASILVAQEMGAALGVRGAAVFQALQVVEGQCGLKPDYARGRLVEAGYDIDDDEQENRHGFPVAATVTVTGPDGRSKSVTYRLSRALRGGMLDSVILADGTEVQSGGAFDPDDVVDVRARSYKGKAKPWESATGNMLRHGADREYIRRYALHITGGMIPLVGGMREDDEVDARGAREPAALGQVIREASTRQHAAAVEAAEYDPADDLELIQEKTGTMDWRPHVGATVRRRSKVQLAADRLAKWATDLPREAAAVLRMHVEPVDAEVVEEPEPVLLNPPPGVAGPHATREPVGAQEWHNGADDLPRAQEAAQAPLLELQALWAGVYDLIGDVDAGRAAVTRWVLSQGGEFAHLSVRTQWQELPAAAVQAYLNAMEAGTDD